jgi:uncharacterized protein DUF3237
MTIPLRDYFLERDLRYVFSYSVELRMERQEIGLVPGGVRVNIFASGGDVYQVLNERAPWAEGNIRGKVLPGGADWAFLREDDVGLADVSLAFRTTDGAYIESRYKGVFPLGPGGYRELLRETDSRGEPVDLVGTPDKPFLARLYVTPTYQTSHPRYQWLTRLQCVGYGEVKIVRGEAKEVTVDVYAMS